MWKHRLTKVDSETRTAVCEKCGPVRIHLRSSKRKNNGRWRCVNSTKLRKSHNIYRKYKKNVCSRCGFVPEHKCQLDVHHIDLNHKNNEPENLQTLCANCHRLISKNLNQI